MSKYEKFLLSKIILFDNKRWNQIFLYFYIFDDFKEYKNYFSEKIKDVYRKKDLYQEIKKIWTKYK